MEASILKDERTIVLRPCPLQAVTAGLQLIVKGEELPWVANIIAGQEEYSLPEDLDISRIISINILK